MLHDSQHVRVSADDGIATLWLDFPGTPVNPLSAARLQEVGGAVEAVKRNPAIEILVVRSAKPGGFCGGFDPAALRSLVTDIDAAAFAATGQRVLTALRDAPVVSVAFIHGPCLGPGLELALACDYRLAVTGPDAWVGFDDQPTCWGGLVRLTSRYGLRTAERFAAGRWTAREAARLGVFDKAFCERRGKIELRAWLDRLQRHPRKRKPGWRERFRNEAAELAAERRRFRTRGEPAPQGSRVSETPELLNPIQPLTSVGLVGNGWNIRHLAGEFAMRGIRVRMCGSQSGDFTDAIRRGRLTPLEADQATARITVHPDAETVCGEMIYIDGSAVSAAGFVERELPPRAILAVPPSALPRVLRLAARPGRVVGLELDEGSATPVAHQGGEADALAAITQWLTDIGCQVREVRQFQPVRSLVTV